MLQEHEQLFLEHLPLEYNSEDKISQKRTDTHTHNNCKITFTSLPSWNHTNCNFTVYVTLKTDWRSLQLRYLSLPINVIPVFLLHPHYTSCICVIFDLPYIIEIIWISSMTKALAIQATQPILGLRMRTKIIFINVVLIIYLCWIMW